MLAIRASTSVGKHRAATEQKAVVCAQGMRECVLKERLGQPIALRLGVPIKLACLVGLSVHYLDALHIPFDTFCPGKCSVGFKCVIT